MNQDLFKSSPIAPRNWQSVLEDYQASAPYNYAVMDNFLQPVVCEQLHQELLKHVGWRYQSQTDRSIVSNIKPDVGIIFAIAESIKAQCLSIFSDCMFSNYELVEHWALMYPKNLPGKVHSDMGALTLNIWLTPDQHNLDPSAGGLIFFDVKRGLKTLPDQSLPYLWSEQYLRDFTRGQQVSVSYKCNRALLFDAKTFHQTDAFCFSNTKLEAHRINLSLTFEDPIIYYDRINSFKKEVSNSGTG